MDLNERKIKQAAGIFMLAAGLAMAFFDLKSGTRTVGPLIIPAVFIIVALSILFRGISGWFSQAAMLKLLSPKPRYGFLGVFIALLLIFAIPGFLPLFFAAQLKWDIGLSGWIAVCLSAFFALALIHGLIFGAAVSEKRLKLMRKRRNRLSADDRGITVEMPLFDKSCFMAWQSIEAIAYYNYIADSDFTEHYAGYRLYLNAVPIYAKYEKQFWLNRLFPKDSQSRIIDIGDGTECFWEMPKVAAKYLGTKADIETKDAMKSALVSRRTYKSGNKAITSEHWRPNGGGEEEIIFNRSNRILDEIRKSCR
ncbi:hypothetical protein [Flavobacterium nitrogenifigens]|uniref:Uncharacterized protein n=1 Tax=Flavobacterium nitrogenifigens TaxID=1617283 RepID=A0A521F9M2_9FLAO|nr:hypothetical protein [Flavobacterium nitrogenifigens]KAF2337789.1 hypothetical protein DM397_03670 [Flavobacterium nitrogenifigens]SMO92190.1 hypothetical protein SAMN06265220_10725 [Flavobacterium nitrogenifigens]